MTLARAAGISHVENAPGAADVAALAWNSSTTEVVACNPKSSTNGWNHSTTGEFVPARKRQGPKSRPVLG